MDSEEIAVTGNPRIAVELPFNSIEWIRGQPVPQGFVEVLLSIPLNGFLVSLYT